MNKFAKYNMIDEEELLRIFNDDIKQISSLKNISFEEAKNAFLDDFKNASLNDSLVFLNVKSKKYQACALIQEVRVGYTKDYYELKYFAYDKAYNSSYVISSFFSDLETKLNKSENSLVVKELKSNLAKINGYLASGFDIVKSDDLYYTLEKERRISIVDKMHGYLDNYDLAVLMAKYLAPEELKVRNKYSKKEERWCASKIDNLFNTDYDFDDEEIDAYIITKSKWRLIKEKVANFYTDVPRLYYVMTSLVDYDKEISIVETYYLEQEVNYHELYKHVKEARDFLLNKTKEIHFNLVREDKMLEDILLNLDFKQIDDDFIFETKSIKKLQK